MTTLWTELWRDPASKHPELFGALLPELSAEPRGVFSRLPIGPLRASQVLGDHPCDHF